ncbi:GNAT family N-acetyltransferase [Anaerobacillus isosaccharinicus]|uniref:GNAT family N-acetyltransferase n=1 Tax=Anaerobacillus isosaccharinicus TaxID=1532552 RepID=A0A1S2LHR7_9BACI|nr:GNAT family N-acetyltransferase [Anaerobacillus isosaccharinicus]MBA5586284.1 GNAT family N-acetyltransferase [Anaerobacillus isosaccharinicus]QOY35465.1 GNAT family N-acetyltransferase [Anaerobacillus isosaccharinicus]
MLYKSSLEGISEKMLTGFFVGWPNPPAPATHLKLLKNSSHIVLAIDEKTEQVVGFITAISDGVLSAYIPLLEVLPDYQKREIGKQLVSQMLKQLEDIYMVDLMCDKDLQPFYEKLGMIKSTGMIVRNYNMQSGK